LSEVQQSTPRTFDTSPRNGWILFAGVMIAVTGALNFIDGFVALYRTRFFKDTLAFGNLRQWAIVALVFGGLQVAAGLAILGRQGWGRWFGLITVAINAFAQLYVISTFPVYAAIIIAYDIAIFYALAVQWRRAPAS
jgi:hypothetical protein